MVAYVDVALVHRLRKSYHDRYLDQRILAQRLDFQHTMYQALAPSLCECIVAEDKQSI